MTTKNLGISMIVMGIGLLAVIYFNRPKEDNTYKAEFEKLIEQNKFEIMRELHNVEHRIRLDLDKVKRKQNALNLLNDSLNKFPTKYEKNRNNVNRIPDDSLRSAFTNEFK